MSLFSGIKRNAGTIAGAATFGGGNTLLGRAYDLSRQPGYGGYNGATAAQMRAGQYNTEQIGLEHQRDAENAQRQAALADLDRGYANPQRLAGMENVYKANLDNQLAGLQQGFRQDSQHAGLAAARRGRLGSSYDAETQARLQQGLQQDVMGAENQAYGQLNALRTRDEAQHQALRQAILAGNPETAALYRTQAQAYGNNADQLQQQAAIAEQNRQLRDQQRYLGYETVGNVLSSAGRGVNNYYGNY